MLGSGKMHSVQQMVEIAFQSVGLDWKKYTQSPPGETRKPSLQADSTLIQRKLGWAPKKEFRSMIEEMVKCDLEQS